jgi:hypothetical protein
MTWVPFESLLSLASRRGSPFIRGLNIIGLSTDVSCHHQIQAQVFVPLLFLWNCRSRYSTDLTHFSHIYLNTMKARHTDSILSSVLQHAISNISKLSGHSYDRFLFKYVPPPKRKGMTPVTWGVLVLNFLQNHVLHIFQFVIAYKDFKFSEITILTWGQLTLRVFSFWVHWSCVQLTIAHSLWAISSSPTEAT